MFLYCVMPRRYRTLADYFEQTGRSHQSLADKLGVSRNYISMMTSLKRQPALALALRIESLTGVPVESLLVPEAKAS